MGVINELKTSIDDERRHSLFLPDEEGAVHGEAFVIGDSLYSKYQRFVAKFGVEARGIERVPEDERSDRHTFKAGTMWCASNMVVSSFAIGVLAIPVFDLGFVDSLLTIIFFNFLGIFPVAFFSTFGPRFGLRQVVMSRFFWGFYGVKLIAVLNCLACLGWSAVNTIVGAQLIHAVNPAIPGYGGILIIAAATFLITLFGYKVVHYYEMISWIPSFIVFLIILGVFAHSGEFVNLPMGNIGTSEPAKVLSFGAAVMGFSIGWASYASDYTCYQPRNANTTRIFLWVVLGLSFPLLFTQMLGLAVATATAGPASNGYAAAYENNAVGGLLANVLFEPLGTFGKFCLVVMALSVCANNAPNQYSFSLSLQVISRYTQAVPRSIWTLVGTIIYCAVAIPGYSHFESVLENFMLIIAYWLSIYTAISLSEHFIFKKGFAGYAPEHYDQPGKLPPSFAAIGAFCFGVCGAVLGMAQIWFVGPIGQKVGGLYGGDVGFECAAAFAFVAYLPMRYFEKKRFGR